jgi:hypothetical protein
VKPAIYQVADNPQQMVVNAEQFVKQVSKKAGKYSDEDWNSIVEEQFLYMTKNYVEFEPRMTVQEKDRFAESRLKFVKALGDLGRNDLALRTKEIYSMVMD